MIIKHISDEIIFDAIPTKYHSNNKIFITHLPPTSQFIKLKPNANIYTSAFLAAQCQAYLECKGAVQFTDVNFHIITPYEPMQLHLENGNCFDVLAGEADGVNRNLMLLFKKDNKVNVFYAGNCVNVRKALLNETFAEWIQLGVELLYLNLTRADETWVSNEINTAIERIQHIFKTEGIDKINLVLPIFGYEDFIAKLARTLRAHVALTGIFHNVYRKLTNMQDFQNNIEKAKIIVTNKIPTISQIKDGYTIYKRITMTIKDYAPNVEMNSNDNYGCYDLQWSPLPTPFHLQLLTSLVHPASIKSTTTNITPQLPAYLKKLCVSNKMPANKGAPLAGQRLTKEGIAPGRNTAKAFLVRKCNLRFVDESDSDEV